MPLPLTAALARRHQQVRQSLESLRVGALIVIYSPNIRYLTNHVGSAGILVLSRESAHLLIDFRYEEAVRRLRPSPSACPALRTWPVPASYDEALLGCLQEIGVTTVGFE